jgi:hypothetical protein
MDKANADQDMSLDRRFQTKAVFFEMPFCSCPSGSVWDWRSLLPNQETACVKACLGLQGHF